MNVDLLIKKTQGYLDNFCYEFNPSDEGVKLLILKIKQTKVKKTQGIIDKLYKHLTVKLHVQRNIETMLNEKKDLDSLYNSSEEPKIPQKEKYEEIGNTISFLKDTSHLPLERWVDYLSGKNSNTDNLFDGVSEEDRDVENKFINAIKELITLNKYDYEPNLSDEQIINEIINSKDDTINVESLSIDEVLHYLRVISYFYNPLLSVPWHIEFNMDFVWCKLMCKATAYLAQSSSQLHKDFSIKKRTGSSTKTKKEKIKKNKQNILSLQKNMLKANPNWLIKTEQKDRIKYYWSTLKDAGGYPTRQTIRKYVKEIEM